MLYGSAHRLEQRRDLQPRRSFKHALQSSVVLERRLALVDKLERDLEGHRAEIGDNELTGAAVREVLLL